MLPETNSSTYGLTMFAPLPWFKSRKALLNLKAHIYSAFNT